MCCEDGIIDGGIIDGGIIDGSRSDKMETEFQGHVAWSVFMMEGHNY